MALRSGRHVIDIVTPTSTTIPFYDCIDLGIVVPSESYHLYKGEWHVTEYQQDTTATTAQTNIKEERDDDCFYDPVEEPYYYDERLWSRGQASDGPHLEIPTYYDCRLNELGMSSHYDTRSVQTCRSGYNTRAGANYSPERNINNALQIAQPSENDDGRRFLTHEENMSSRSSLNQLINTTDNTPVTHPNASRSSTIQCLNIYPEQSMQIYMRSLEINQEDRHRADTTHTAISDATVLLQNNMNDSEQIAFHGDETHYSNLTDDVKAETRGYNRRHISRGVETSRQFRANSNCNANNKKRSDQRKDDEEDPDTHDDGEMQTLQDLYQQLLVARLERVRDTRRKLTKKANMLFAWNVIQLFFLLIMIVYATTCICSFRKAFSCSKPCPRKITKGSRNFCHRKKFWEG